MKIQNPPCGRCMSDWTGEFPIALLAYRVHKNPWIFHAFWFWLVIAPWVSSRLVMSHLRPSSWSFQEKSKRKSGKWFDYVWFTICLRKLWWVIRFPKVKSEIIAGGFPNPELLERESSVLGQPCWASQICFTTLSSYRAVFQIDIASIPTPLHNYPLTALHEHSNARQVSCHFCHGHRTQQWGKETKATNMSIEIRHSKKKTSTMLNFQQAIGLLLDNARINKRETSERLWRFN